MGPIKLIIIKRTVLAMLLGLGFGFLLSEVSFHFIKETNRPPQTVTLEIPAGTADAIARGVAAPSIPGEMTFVVGDVYPSRRNGQAGAGREAEPHIYLQFQPDKYLWS